MPRSRSDTPPSSITIGRLPTSSIGPLWVAVSALGLLRVNWDMPEAVFVHQIQGYTHPRVVYDESHTAPAIRQLAEYLAGSRRQFTLQLDLSHQTSFQRQVLILTAKIPYGQTSTYKDLAIQAGLPQAARAVGRVQATNPLPIVIPCHRVLGSDGSLHGYGGPGGIKLKAWLLQLERSA